MFHRRRTPRHRAFRLVRRSFPRRSSRFRKAFVVRKRLGVAKRGYVKNYRSAALASRTRRLTVRKIGKVLPAKRHFSLNSGITITNGAGTTDRCMVYMPLGHLVQSVATATQPVDYMSTFQSIKILLTGIKLGMFLASTQNEDYYVRLMAFWCTNDYDTWNAVPGDITNVFTNTGSLANTISVKQNDGLRFLDVPYGVPGGYPDFANITARPNPNYPGKLLYDRVFKMTLTGYNTLVATTNPTRKVDIWLPFHKEFEWSTYPLADDPSAAGFPLTVSPNFGKYGQPVFALYYANAEAIGGGTQRAFNFVTDCREYFRDV